MIPLTARSRDLPPSLPPKRGPDVLRTCTCQFFCLIVHVRDNFSFGAEGPASFSWHMLCHGVASSVACRHVWLMGTFRAFHTSHAFLGTESLGSFRKVGVKQTFLPIECGSLSATRCRYAYVMRLAIRNTPHPQDVARNLLRHSMCAAPSSPRLRTDRRRPA